MRILHTSDWHLGHRLYDRDRTEEHRAALDWLLTTIREEGVELLIVAGDVFDTMNPSNAARNLYYDFLGRLQRTGCHATVVVGGNHDSPSLLDAPARVLSHLNVHLIGGARRAVAEQVIPIFHPDRPAAPALLVAAIPFLRERDLKFSVVGETATDKVSRVQRAIREHFATAGAAAGAVRTDANVPIVATGHLFAAGGEDAEDKASHIYLADQHNIEAGQFPEIFDYVALGHIHRAQRVGGQDRIQYSGGIIPLTFGEARLRQSVTIFDLEHAGQEIRARRIPVPVHRRLHSLRGTVTEVKDEITALLATCRAADEPAPAPWVEVRVNAEHPVPLLRQELLELLAPTTAETDTGRDASLPQLLRSSTQRPDRGAAQDGTDAALDLSDLRPEEVFYRLCHRADADGERADYPDLLATFRELRNWMTDKAAAE